MMETDWCRTCGEENDDCTCEYCERCDREADRCVCDD